MGYDAASGGPPRSISYTVITRPEKDWDTIQKKEHLDPLVLKLRQTEDDVRLLVESFDQMRVREMRHRNTNESTNSRVAWISFMSLASLTVLGVLQLLYFRNFFKAKRLI
jgi:p24 family protein delta-1